MIDRSETSEMVRTTVGTQDRAGYAMPRETGNVKGNRFWWERQGHHPSSIITISRDRVTSDIDGDNFRFRHRGSSASPCEGHVCRGAPESTRHTTNTRPAPARSTTTQITQVTQAQYLQVSDLGPGTWLDPRHVSRRSRNTKSNTNSITLN